MKLNKILFLGLAAALSLTACSDDDDYTAGAPRNENAAGVNFENTPSSVTLGAADESFTITVSREKTEGALTVPFKVNASVEGIFTVPSSVTFEDGQADAEIEVKASTSMEIMKAYRLYIDIPEEFYDQYGVDAYYPNLILTVMRNDYKAVATGVYDCGFFEQQWAQDLEYSEALDRYRFKDLWYPGSEVQFTFDRETGAMAPCEDAFTSYTSGGANRLGWYTGVDSYGQYGALYARPAKYTSGAWAYQYNAQYNAFVFIHFWEVGAGQFGNFQDVFYIQQWLDGGEGGEE